MGDGQRLKEILDQKGISTRTLAKQAGISPTTLYSIISKDTNIRFDFALRIANILGIGTREICSGALFELDEEQEKAITLPEFPSGLDAALDGSLVLLYF